MTHNYNLPLINNKYECTKLIGTGKFGEIYLGIDNSKNKTVAIKLENKGNSYVTLKNEATILKYLHDRRCSSIPLLHWFGNYQNKFAIVLTKYDCSLYEYALNHSLSDNTINDIMLKMLSIIEDIHKLFIVHRDIKPHHFMIRNDNLYLIDFGISTFYIDENQKLKPNNKTENMIGSPNYASYYVHGGHSYSRRDDMISLGYIYIYLHFKKLPWDNINIEDNYCNSSEIKNKSNIARREMKQIDNLHKFVDPINSYISTYFSYCYYLDYHEAPNYIDNIALFYY